MAITPRGVRMINENVVQKGRAFIVTDEDFDSYNWNDLPDGTLHIDAETGLLSVKLKGETTWSPVGLKNDGTLVISKDTQFEIEIFTIISIDDGDGNFTYENANGQRRHKQVISSGASFLFELEEGTYLQGRNHLEVTIDDVLTRTVMSGGVEEVSEKRFILHEPLVAGQKIAVRYVKWVKIGNPYPRIFLSAAEPDDPEEGDFWLDPNGSLEEGSPADEIADEPKKTVNWEQIIGTPTTVKGYGIVESVAMEGHTHRALDITDFPSSLPANGGDANSLQDHVPGKSPDDIVIVEGDGHIDNSLISDTMLEDTRAVYIQEKKPSSPRDKSIWICTDEIDNKPHIEVYIDYQWLKIGSV